MITFSGLILSAIAQAFLDALAGKITGFTTAFGESACLLSGKG
jgi:hypothetical protein